MAATSANFATKPSKALKITFAVKDVLNAENPLHALSFNGSFVLTATETSEVCPVMITISKRRQTTEATYPAFASE